MEAPPVIAPARERLPSAWWLMTALPVAAVVATLYLFNPSQYGFYPRCALYVTTGLYCPGCGSLRALHQLAHGHLLAAMRCNVLLIASLPFAAIYAWRWVRCRASGRTLPRFFLSARAVMLLSVVLVIFTILRNIRCAPFTYLAPP